MSDKLTTKQSSTKNGHSNTKQQSRQFMEPIVLVDKQHNQEAHVIVASHYTFDDVLLGTPINVGMFEGNWDLSY
ncbi:MAG: hypothetical protein IPN94_24945 [Sphingobacteriales bacterium]|nr:hypothetical protein [Sphingobacteriales bacterium]